MTTVVLITGSNAGDRRANIDMARSLISEMTGTISAASSVMDSAPWGDVSPDVAGMDSAPDAETADFLNQALVIETALAPEDLLNTLQEIERRLGRVRTDDIRHDSDRAYLSRTMDIDILFYGDEIIDTPRLIIPHPMLHERAFVLRPLCEIIPERIHPTLGKTIAELYEQIRQ
jgi:2-amino-4-hydroxy-6-hydroxymethyldihydropteridine diphosphokinase